MRYIIIYGRPFSPMPPWGIEGGGPLNDQQVDTLLAYLKSIQIPASCRRACGTRWCCRSRPPAGRRSQQASIDEAARRSRSTTARVRGSYGEALFNLNLSSGAYSCARCHTPGWS